MNNDNLLQTIESLKQSKFRSWFKLREKDLAYIREKGLETIKDHAVDFITSRVADAFPENDGKQTPMKNHPVFIAQHATATCCRGCILKWHNIPKDRTLYKKEIKYIVDLIMTWIELQMELVEKEA